MSIPHRIVARPPESVPTPYPGDNPGLVYQKLVGIVEGMKEAEPIVLSMAEARFSNAYRAAFQRWVRATPPLPGRRVVAWFETTQSVACGLGESFPAENGLALLPPWGFPYLPGASLKGVTRAWCRAQSGGELSGDLAALFGTGGSAGMAGVVDFLDAWILPDQHQPHPFVAEVLTPHQVPYYQHQGAPSGFEGPNPVRFLAARGIFRVVLEGPRGSWLELALELVTSALEEHGIGAKTRTGYGRLRRLPAEGVPDPRLYTPLAWEADVRQASKRMRDRWRASLPAPPPPSGIRERVAAWLERQSEPERLLALAALHVWDLGVVERDLRRRIERRLEECHVDVETVLAHRALYEEELAQAITAWEGQYWAQQRDRLLAHWHADRGSGPPGRKKVKAGKKGGRKARRRKKPAKDVPKLPPTTTGGGKSVRAGPLPPFYEHLRELPEDSRPPIPEGTASRDENYLESGPLRHAHRNLLLKRYPRAFAREVLLAAWEQSADDADRRERLQAVARLYRVELPGG